MRILDCPALEPPFVELTDEREAHIELRHPDLLPEHIAELEAAQKGTLRGRTQRVLECEAGLLEVVSEPSGRKVCYRAGGDRPRRTRPTLDRDGILGLHPAVNRMKRMKIRFSYDKTSDTLQIDWCDPYPEQDSRSIEKGVLVRVNPETQVVENLEILDFEARFGKAKRIELPVTGALQLTVG